MNEEKTKTGVFENIRTTVTAKYVQFQNDKKMTRNLEKTRKLLKNTVAALFRTVFLVGFSFIILYPLLTLISKSFMHTVDIYDNTVLWIPRNITLENLKFAYKLMIYPQAFLNSAMITLLTTVLQTGICMAVGYGFARFEFKFKKIWFALVVLTIVVPPQQIMMPLYLYFKNFDFLGIYQLITGNPGPSLLNSPWPFLALALTGQGLKNGLFIFIFRQFFKAMPKETEEAAWVDGAGPVRTFVRIMVPGAITAIATVALFSFVWEWNDVFYSGLFLKDFRMLPQAFQLFNTYLTGGEMFNALSEASRFNIADGKVVELLRNAGIFLIMAPLLIVYIITQKFFVESIERTGIVG